MRNIWGSNWEETWEDEHERTMELNGLATDLFLLFDEHELVDSELLEFLGSIVSCFFEELISSNYSPPMIRSVSDFFLKKLANKLVDALETQKVIEAYEESI